MNSNRLFTFSRVGGYGGCYINDHSETAGIEEVDWEILEFRSRGFSL